MFVKIFIFSKFLGKIFWIRQFVDVSDDILLAWFSFDSDLFLNLILRLISFGNMSVYILVYPTKG